MSEETPAHLPEEVTARSGPSAGSRVISALIIVLMIGAAAYGVHERNVANRLAAVNGAIAANLSTTRDQLNALSSKVSALETRTSPDPATKPAALIYHRPLRAAVARHRIDDPRWKKMQGQLDEQGRQIESTRQDLASTRTDLTGSIARTHDELVLLEKKGERSYFEFDLDKADRFQRQGPISIRLRKANTKHDYADLELLVDDSKVTKKHVNVFEPVVFYPADEKMPVEIVINGVTKNHIHGYVSAPKYRGADLQAMANAGATGSAGSSSSSDQAASDGKPSPTRQKLPLQGTTGQ